MAKLDFPSSPTDGQVYAAPNNVDYTWSAAIGAWTAKVSDPLTLVSNGSISGTAEVGKTLAYSGGVATGGEAPYTYTWEWRLTSDNSVLQNDGLTLTIPARAAGDTIYIALTATDAAANTATGDTDVYPTGGNVIRNLPFPNLLLGPISGPNASPSTVSLAGEGLYGEVSATWEDGFTTIYATGDIQFSVNGGAYGNSLQSVSNGDTVSVIWDATAIAGAADGATLIGILSNGTYDNGFSIIIDRAPTDLVFADLVDQGLITVVTSDTVTPTGYNVPVPVSFAGSATALTSLGLSVAGGAFGASPQNVIPGQSLQLQGTTGATGLTAYGVDIAMGSNPTATDTWTVTTADLTQTIAEPSITSPANGATDIDPGVNNPAGAQLVGSNYTPLNSAGAVQTSSTWEVYKGGPGSSFQSTATISAVASAVPTIGSEVGGGYFAGQIVGAGSTSGAGGLDNAGTIYNLIVAPESSGGLTGSLPLEIEYRTSNAPNGNTNAQNENFGGLCTSEVLAGSATGGATAYPVFNSFINGATGPNAGAFNLTSGGSGSGTGIGGYNDWYLPAKNELAVIYFFLKPNSFGNTTSSGSNPVSVAPYTPNTNYGPGFPNISSSALFAGGSESMIANDYWSSTEYSSNANQAWAQYFYTGDQGGVDKTNQFYARAVRRVSTSSPVAQSLSITGANTDGFSVGMAVRGSSSGATGIITAIDGTSVKVSLSSGAFTTSDRLQGNGTALTGSPYTVSAAPFTTVTVPQADLTTSSTYYARVQYATTNALAATSEWSAWSEFATASSFS